jgi:hypothetical protein
VPRGGAGATAPQDGDQGVLPADCVEAPRAPASPATRVRHSGLAAGSPPQWGCDGAESRGPESARPRRALVSNASIVTMEWSMVGLHVGEKVGVRDAIRHTDNCTSTGPSLSAIVQSHDVVVLVLTKIAIGE